MSSSAINWEPPVTALVECLVGVICELKEDVKKYQASSLREKNATPEDITNYMTELVAEVTELQEKVDFYENLKLLSEKRKKENEDLQKKVEFYEKEIKDVRNIVEQYEASVPDFYGKADPSDIVQVVQDLQEKVDELEDESRHFEEMDELSEIFGFSKDYADSTNYDWGCYVRDCGKKFKEVQEEVKKLEEQVKTLTPASMERAHLLNRNRTLEKENEEKELEMARVMLEKYYFSGSGGSPCREWLKKEAKELYADQPNHPEHTAIWKYMVDYYGWDEDEDEDEDIHN